MTPLLTYLTAEMSKRRIDVLIRQASAVNALTHAGEFQETGSRSARAGLSGSPAAARAFSIGAGFQPYSARKQAGIPVPARKKSSAPILAIQRVGLRHRDRQNRGSTYEAARARYADREADGSWKSNTEGRVQVVDCPIPELLCSAAWVGRRMFGRIWNER